MYNEQERELKCMLTKEEFDHILSSYDFPILIDQINTYFDTSDQLVRKEGCAIRIRRIKDRFIFTLKKRTDPITLIELENDVSSDDIEEITDPKIISWCDQYHIPLRDLKPVTSIRTVRHLMKTEKAEICLDHTYFSHTQDYEIEYEYLQDHDGIRAFNEFLKPFGLQFKKNCSSKIARAMKYNSSDLMR